MTEYDVKRPLGRSPAHPCTQLEAVIAATGKTKVEIAELLGISRRKLYDILRERKPVSTGVAARFGKMIGDGAAILPRMQASHDAWQAECDGDVGRPPTLTAA